MSDWTISRRLNTLTAALLAAIAIVAVIAIFAGLRSLSSFAAYTTQSAQFTAVANLEAALYRARIDALHYRRTGDARFAEDARTRLGELLASEARVVASFPEGSEEVVTLQDVFEGLREYEAAFERLLASEAAQGEIAAEMDTLAQELTALAQQIAVHPTVQAAEGSSGAAFRLASELDSAIDHFESFEFARRSDDAFEAKSHVAETRTIADGLLGTAPAAAAPLGSASERLAAFDRGLDRLIAENEVRNLAAAELDRLGAEKQAEMDEVTARIHEAQSETGAAGARTAALAVAVVAAMALLLSGVALFVARRIAQDLRMAVEQTVSETQGLVEGKLDTAITGADARNEFGTLARALEVFRTNAIAAKEAEARQREQGPAPA